MLMARWLCVVQPAVLSELKVASLETQKKEAKQGYQEYLQAYVTSYLGQPLEKVHVSLSQLFCMDAGLLDCTYEHTHTCLMALCPGLPG